MAKAASVSEDKLKRERAGTYRTADGRFTVEQTSSGWLLMDGEQSDDLGLMLARGPFATLDGARAAIAAARTAPAPTSELRRPAGRPGKPAAAPRKDSGAPRKPDRGLAEAPPEPAIETKTSKPPRLLRTAPPRPGREVVIREIRAVDGDALRALWREAGFGELGDDDRSLARLARRNPGLVLVAAEGTTVIGSALGAWDGRRGWIYHVAIAPSHRRRGIATRLVEQIEASLVSLGCPKANVMLGPDSDGGPEFWTARGYEVSPNRQLGKELGSG